MKRDDGINTKWSYEKVSENDDTSELKENRNNWRNNTIDTRNVEIEQHSIETTQN